MVSWSRLFVADIALLVFNRLLARQVIGGDADNMNNSFDFSTILRMASGGAMSQQSGGSTPSKVGLDVR